MTVEHIIIPKFDRQEGQSSFDAPKGHWTFTNNEPPTIFIRCPEGHFSFLNHRIDADGKVTSSILCLDDDGAGKVGKEHFHVFGTLQDWHLGLREQVEA